MVLSKKSVFQDFFYDGNMSDIHGMEYFENHYNLSLLGLMVDVMAWTTVLPSRPELWMDLASVISPVLCWFNRQIVSLLCIMTHTSSFGLMVDCSYLIK